MGLRQPTFLRLTCAALTSHSRQNESCAYFSNKSGGNAMRRAFIAARGRIRGADRICMNLVPHVTSLSALWRRVPEARDSSNSVLWFCTTASRFVGAGIHAAMIMAIDDAVLKVIVVERVDDRAHARATQIMATLCGMHGHDRFRTLYLRGR